MSRSNKYRGACASCGSAVQPQAGTITKVGQRWVVYCGHCSGRAPSVAAPTITKRRGICEDAPCCGCCGGNSFTAALEQESAFESRWN